VRTTEQRRRDVPSRGAGDRGHHSRWLAVFVCLGLLVGSVVQADEVGGKDREPRFDFKPFATLGGAVRIQEYEATITTDAFGAAETKRGNNTISSFVLDFEVGVLGPELGFLPVVARPFLRGGVMVPTDGRGTIESSVNQVRKPQQTRELNSTKFDVEWSPIWTAGAGLEILVSTPIPFKLSPSVEFRRTEVKYLSTIEQTVSSIALPVSSFYLKSEKEVTQTFLGPGLRLSAGFEPSENFVFEGFVDGSLLWDVGGTLSRFSETNGVQTVHLQYEAESMSIEIGAGLSIRWR